MGSTETEKILARGSGRSAVRPGEIINIQADRVMMHDNGAANIIEKFTHIIDASVWDPERVALFIDHHSPSTAIKWAGHHDIMRRFARENGITHFFDCGSGICHIAMIEEGLAGPGDIVIGADSHTTGEGARGAFATGVGATEMAVVLATGKLWLQVPETIKIILEGSRPEGVYSRDIMATIMGRLGPDGANYKSVEFHGSAADAFSFEERLQCCVQCVDIGAKNAMFVSNGDPEAKFVRVEHFDVSAMEPVIAVPSLPTNVVPLREVAEKKIVIEEAYIGSCAGGLLVELEAAARILDGKRVAPGVRLIVLPASRKIFNEALSRGYIKTLHDAGAVIGSPACGACGGHDVGILANGETCISNSTRNMVGRMGPGGSVYLASAATVTASAHKGYIFGEKV